ncbi:MAG: hypothetical protein ACFFCO_07010 [Promethearchaeota archaeon]
MTGSPLTIGESYILHAHQLDFFLKRNLGEKTIFVDSYFGPSLSPDISIAIDDYDELLRSLKGLQTRVRAEVQDEPRRTFLFRQLDAMILLLRFALDEPLTFEQRVRIGLDIEPTVIRNERVEELQEQTFRMLRRKEMSADLATMATQWRKRALTEGSEVIKLAKEAAAKARRLTQQILFKLPESEEVEFRSVKDAPWLAYNHYKGNYRALIEVNTKLPQSKYSVWAWVCHETYPGHQTQLVSRELGYNHSEFDVEATIALINTPDCTIVEGLANTGTTILGKGHPLSEGEQISAQLGRLRRVVGINALVMLNQQGRSEKEVLAYLMDFGALDEEYAKARIPFMTDPMWAPYGFTYFVGAWLVKGFFDAAQEAGVINEFVKALYHELHTPTTLKERIAELGLKLPAEIL